MVKTTKIIQVLSSLNVGSGIANFVMNYYRKIDRSQCQFDFLVFAKVENSFAEEVESLGGKIFYFDKLNLFNILTFRKKLKKFFREHQGEYDVIHLHEILVQAFVLPVAKKFGIKKRILHVHARKKTVGLLKRVRNKLLYCRYDRNAEIYAACSVVVAREQFKKTLFSQTVIIRNAIDFSRYLLNTELRNKVRKQLSLENRIVMGSVGRFSSEKNTLFLLDIFSAAYRRNSSVRLVLLGDGALRKSVEDKIAQYGLQEQVILLGNQKEPETFLQALDLFVFPSVSEGLGISLIEVQVSGLPCLASTNVPNEAIISKRTRTLSLEKSADKWGEELLDMYGERVSCDTEVLKSGFNVIENKARLMEIYGVVSK